MLLEQNNLKNFLEESIKEFYDKDSLLSERKGMEQACVFRIGLYLQERLKKAKISDVVVDCEYNKNGDHPKRTVMFVEGVRPDLLIHKRGNNTKNLLVVEFKGWWNRAKNRDEDKLKSLTSSKDVYHYLLGAFVRLGKENIQDLEYYANGEKLNN